MNNAQTIITELQSLANEKHKQIWIDFGIQTPDLFLGVQLTQLKEIAKKIKKNHQLALELWNTNVHDAKLLATFIVEPKKITVGQLNDWASQIYSPDLADKFASNVVVKSVFAESKMIEWINSQEEFIKRCAYKTLCEIAKNNTNLTNNFFEQYLRAIENQIKNERNWIKEIFAYTLIAIGSRNTVLNQKTLEVAKKIGEIHINYGKSSCKSPDVISTLQKTKF